jgi:hypothetical protein
MKLTKSKLKQLIKEALEDEQLGPDIEGGDDESGGKIRIQARLRSDDAFKAAQEDAVGNDYGGQNTYQMAEFVVTLPDGEEIVIPDNQTFENMEGRERAIRDAFTMASGLSLKTNKYGYNLPSEESKIEGFTGISQPGGFDEDGNLLDRKFKDFQVFIDGFEIPKQGAASDELIKAFKKYKGKKPTYMSYKPASRGPSRRRDINYDEPYGGDVVARRNAAYAKRRYEEGKLTKGKNKMKLTKSALKQMIREQLEEKPSDPLHEAYYAMRDFVDNLRDEALQEEGIDLADGLFDAIHDVMPFPDRD